MTLQRAPVTPGAGAGSRPARRLSRSRGWYVAGCFGLLCFVHLRWADSLAGVLSQVAVVIGAAAFGWWAVVRRPGTQRFGWVCIVAGLSSSALGDVLYIVITQFFETPAEISIADVFWLGSFAAFVPGLLALLVERDAQRRIDTDGLIDMGSFAILAVIVVSEVGDLGSIFADSSLSLAGQLAWVAYPVLDAVLLAVLLRGLVGRRLRHAAGVWLAIGLGAWLTADLLALLFADYISWPSWLDLGWMLGAAAMATAVWHGRSSTAQLPPGRLAPVTGARVLIGLAPLLLPWTLVSVDFLRGERTDPIPLFAASVGLIALAFVRARRLVSVRDRQEAALENERRYYHALAENSADAVVVVDEHDVILNDTPHLAAMLGRRPVTSAGADVVAMLAPGDGDRLRATLARMRLAAGVTQTEFVVRHSDGTRRWLAARSVNLAADPAIRGLVVNLHDVTDRKSAEDELTHRAFHDALTGLANRTLFRDRVEHALRSTARTAGGVAVMYLDVDGFKTVNDSRGHEAGDAVLREIAVRLQACVRTADTVARLGGDEFAILLEPSARPLELAGTVAERILQSLTVPIQLGDQRVVLSASLGVTVSDPLSGATSLLRDADIAMYRAKTSGRGRWAVFDPRMRVAAVERLELETDLAGALARDEFRLVYQPVVRLETEEVVGFEALLRWHHPTRGVVMPAAFIPIAEDTGGIVEIGCWVLAEACRTAAKWRLLRPDRALTMAVNLSGCQLADPGLVTNVTDALVRAGFPAAQLVLEMTESVLVKDATATATRLHALHDLGVRLAIDDFGTGYSSLSYLRQFPIDILKIDRSFINSITDRDQVPAIVRGLLDLGRTLDLETIAEGIELDAQRDSLRDERCELGQGFLFARPLTPDQAVQLLAQLPEQQQTAQPQPS